MSHKNDKDVDLKKKIEEARKEAEKKEQAEALNNATADNSNNGELAKVKQELTQMTELAKHTMADLQNFRRRQEEERQTLYTMANAELILSLLPVLDNLERAKEHVPSALQENSGKEWFKGIEMSIEQLRQVLTSFGLKPIDCLGQKFNPDLHEALAHEQGEKDIVTEELEKGYMLGERVIRHSKVKVGNGKP